jgi:hypothetical protein
MRHLYTIASLCLLTGCATFSTCQRDEDIKADGTKSQVTTTVRASSFFAAGSALSHWKASQSSKTQGAQIGALAVDTQAGTNVAAIAAAVTAAAVGAAVK